MTGLGPDGLPSYDELRSRRDAPPGSTWGLWGDDDVLGCLNLAGPEQVLRAVRAVRTGAVYPLDLPLDQPSPPLFGRVGVAQEVTSILDDAGHEEVLTHLNTQASSQWDGFRHVAHRRHGYYNGIADEDHGVHHWARRGIVARAVLADVDRHRSRHGRRSRPGEADVVEVAEVEAALDEQGIELEPGDVLLVRTGWLAWYRGLDEAGRREAAASMASIGLRPGDELERFLWDHRVSALAADNPAVEVFPPGAGLPAEQRREHFLDPDAEPSAFAHRSLLPLLGLPLGELWDLDALAEASASDGAFDCLLTSAPLHVPSGVASPPNALAVR